MRYTQVMKNSKFLQIFPLLLLVAYIFYNEYQKLDDSPSDTIKTRNLQVVDDRGLVRFEVATTDRDTSLAMFDTGGVLRYRASSQPTGTMLSFYDNEERLLATVGEKEGPEFKMYYENGVQASGIFVNERNTAYVRGPMLMFSNASGRRVVTLTADKKENEGSMFMLESADGEQKNVLVANNEGSSSSLQRWTDGERGDEVRLKRNNSNSSFSIIQNGNFSAYIASEENADGALMFLSRDNGMRFFEASTQDDSAFLFVGKDKAQALFQVGSSDGEIISHLSLSDLTGTVRSQLGIYSNNENGLYVSDSTGKARVSVRENSGTSAVTLTGEDGSLVGALGQVNSDASLVISKNGKELLRAPQR